MMVITIIFSYIGMNSSLHAVCVLPLLLPDVQLKADSSIIIYFGEVRRNVSSG